MAGVTVRVGEDLLHDAAVSHLLGVDEATAGLLHIAMLAVLHLMPMGKSYTMFFCFCLQDDVKF